MAPKQIDGFLFQGIPKMIYLDNGPIARSHVFQQVTVMPSISFMARLTSFGASFSLTGRRRAAGRKSRLGGSLLTRSEPVGRQSRR
jgi:hypothetical protein